jgi:hypothetical protein
VTARHSAQNAPSAVRFGHRRHGIGTFVDDTGVTTTAGTADADGFEGASGLWASTGPPPGNPAAPGGWVFSTVLIHLSAGVATGDTVLVGFGIEQLPRSRTGRPSWARPRPTCWADRARRTARWIPRRAVRWRPA